MGCFTTPLSFGSCVVDPKVVTSGVSSGSGFVVEVVVVCRTVDVAAAAVVVQEIVSQTNGHTSPNVGSGPYMEAFAIA